MGPAESLNLGCLCRTFRPEQLQAQLGGTPLPDGFVERLLSTHPHLFSPTVVFVDTGMVTAVAQAVAATEQVAALPGWQAAALAHAPAIASQQFGPAGVFMGYDFHLADDGPKLIEVNTNAGGAFLNAVLARAHRACCANMGMRFDAANVPSDTEAAFMTMFRSEWQAQRGGEPWLTALITDDAPESQYLAPEFELARAMFERHGITAAVGDARAFDWHGGKLWHPALPKQPIDLVYNRLTDFYLAEPAHAALQQAYVSGAVVLTPHPHVYACLADKRNLVTLSDSATLGRWHADPIDIERIKQVAPRSEMVEATNAEALWARRRSLFFKPTTGYGSRAAYRGDKLTRRVWSEILAGDYVAQAIVPPTERLIEVDGTPVRLKVDVRAYTYRGRILLLAARTWAGQTTNFRTPGGGFAPIVVLPPIPDPGHTTCLP